MADHRLRRPLHRLGKSHTLAINERSKQLMAEGRTVYRFGLGQSPFPVPDSVVAALREHAAEKDYLPVEGLLALRHAVAQFHNSRLGLSLSHEGVVVGPGSKELLFLTMMAFEGDVFIPTPSWVSYGPQAQLAGRSLIRVKTTREGRWRVTPEALDAAFHAVPDDHDKLMVLNYPCNPTGLTYTNDELAALAAVFKKYNVIVISDEIYGELQHQAGHRSLAAHHPEGTIISSGLSKWCGAGGWRLGTFAMPSNLLWLRDAISTIASETFTSVSAPIQYAAVRAFEGGPDIEDYLERSRAVLRTLGPACATRLRQAGAEVHDPEGGFYLFADFEPLRSRLVKNSINNGAQLCEAMLEQTGVAALPGSSFQRPKEELTVRFAYVDFDGGPALAAAGSGFDATALQAHCQHLLEGLDNLAAWFDGL